jgi:hypothetical protein
MTATLLALAACYSSGPTGLSEGLEGSWVWVESTGGIAGWTLNPESEGYAVHLEVDADGTVRAFRNDSLITTSHAQLAERLIQYAGPGREYEVTFEPQLRALVFSAMREHIVRYPERDRVTFADPCCDGYVHVFERR